MNLLWLVIGSLFASLALLAFIIKTLRNDPSFRFQVVGVLVLILLGIGMLIGQTTASRLGEIMSLGFAITAIALLVYDAILIFRYRADTRAKSSAG